jgi:hypothetical protein
VPNDLKVFGFYPNARIALPIGTTITNRENKMANFKDGIIREGSSIGSGSALGNIKDHIVRSGGYLGGGSAVGNIKDGIIREGGYAGGGKAIFNVKDGIVRDGGYLGGGKQIGKVSDYKIIGMERELDADIVAAYHFFVKKIC